MLNKKTVRRYLILYLSILIFTIGGLYHLTKHETIDEHLWKYDRIPKYFQAWKNFEWQKTRINDKPGITMTLITGLGLPFSPAIDKHHNKNEESKYSITLKNGHIKKIYDIYNTELTQKINLALRLPILLVNALVMLPLMYFLITKAFDKNIANFAILLIATSPVLIGISQIINPDALLWSCSASALFSFFAFLKTKKRQYIILSGVLTGFSLLSKYTANLLYIFYALSYIFYYLSHEKDSEKNWKKLFMEYFTNLTILTLISWLIVAVFMPDVLINPKHFLYATIYSPALKPIVNLMVSLAHLKSIVFISHHKYHILPLTITTLILFWFLFIIIPPLFVHFIKKYKHFIFFIGKIFTIAFILIFLISFVNAWMNTPLFSLNDLKEVSRHHKKISFPQFKNDNPVSFWIKATLVQSQNFVFSVRPWIILSFFLFAISILRNKNLKYSWLLYFTSTIPFIFFIGASLSNIFVNIRYSLILYPIFLLISAISIAIIYNKYKNKYKNIIFFGGIIILSVYSLWYIKPFFFNYMNAFLPKQYFVTDSWGYGLYETAQVLNKLPNAKNIVVWSDRGGFCQFFVGKCINSRKIYIQHTIPDYLILNRRGVLTKRPVAVIDGPEKTTFSFDKYYSPKYFNNPMWQIHMGHRPANFMKIIKIKPEN